jgi:hypothetical protein
MNGLFSEVLMKIPHELNYAWLGSLGCGFSLEIKGAGA